VNSITLNVDNNILFVDITKEFYDKVVDIFVELAFEMSLEQKTIPESIEKTIFGLFLSYCSLRYFNKEKFPTNDFLKQKLLELYKQEIKIM
jgi:hypothetical protein